MGKERASCGDGPGIEPSKRARKAFFIVGEAPNILQKERFHLRAVNVLQAASMDGWGGDVCLVSDASALGDQILSSDLIVIVRATMNETLGALMDRAASASVPAAFDLDDYVFDPGTIDYVSRARRFSNEQREAYLSQLKGYRAVFDRCQYFTASTAPLAQRAEDLGRKAYVLRNTLSQEWLRASEAERLKRPASATGGIKIGYFPGTRTHQEDFALALPPLLEVMREFEEASLLLSASLQLSEFPQLTPLASRIEVLPQVPWKQLPREIARVDINIAPLEPAPFCECKSELKYFHAASLEIPTVASSTRPFREAIAHGVTGLLASTDAEWHEGLRALTTDAELRRTLGRNAYSHVMERYTIESLSPDVSAAYHEILEDFGRGRPAGGV